MDVDEDSDKNLDLTLLDMSASAYIGGLCLYAWVKVFWIIPEIRILRPTFFGKSASKY